MPTATRDKVWRYPYTPSPRQEVAHQTVADEMLYGGAAGGGKSEWILAAHVTLALMVPGSASLILRRTFPDLERSLIPRLLERLPRQVATYNATQHVWKFRNGSRIELGHLQRENDVLKYQSAEYQLISFDELTHFTQFQYNYMISRLRAAGAVRDRLAELGWRPRAAAASNPGGPGHHWVKSHFIDPQPPGRVWKPPADLENPRPGTRVFIPAKVTDNPHLDETYADRLASRDPMLRRALLDGDWDILEGVRFTAWRRAVHVIDPSEFPIPPGGSVPKAWGVDYGLDAPFAGLQGAKFGDGLVVVYRELYAPGLTPSQQAEAIAEAEGEDERGEGRPIPIYLDPATWARAPDQPIKSKLDDDRPPKGSIAGAYYDRFGGAVRRAWNNRLAGAALLDDKLRIRADGLPRILVYSTCTNLIRTLPTLPRGKNPEDVDTTSEDHAYDAMRYLLAGLEGRGASAKEAKSGRSKVMPTTETAGLQRGF